MFSSLPDPEESKFFKQQLWGKSIVLWNIGVFFLNDSYDHWSLGLLLAVSMLQAVERVLQGGAVLQ